MGFMLLWQSIGVPRHNKSVALASVHANRICPPTTCSAGVAGVQVSYRTPGAASPARSPVFGIDSAADGSGLRLLPKECSRPPDSAGGEPVVVDAWLGGLPSAQQYWLCFAMGSETNSRLQQCMLARQAHTHLPTHTPAHPSTHPPMAGASASELRFESPTFDGLPVDWCTAPDQGCGQPAAVSFCTAQGYAGAADYAGPTPVSFGNQTVYPASGAACDSAATAGQCTTFYYILCAV